MALKCVDEAIRVWRKLIIRITDIDSNKVLNGESIRGPELVTIKDGQKVPLSLDESAIIFYCDPIEDISIVDATSPSTVQSYELHLIIYGRDCKKISQSLKSNLYTEGALNELRENEIALLDIPSITNSSAYLTSQTYTLRSDMRIRFNVELEDKKVFEENVIEKAEIDDKRI